ncbi:MAG: hypothetical protein HY286_13035 [Planctomycetes bacterium]|nr:hypothetical protein [Planctomycetota bacterium]
MKTLTTQTAEITASAVSKAQTTDSNLTATNRGVAQFAGAAAPHFSKKSAGLPSGSSGSQPGAWKIVRRGRQCSACARTFENGSLVFSTLGIVEFEVLSGVSSGSVSSSDDDGPSFLRLDRCGVCYQKRTRGSEDITWRTLHEEAPKKPRLDLISLTEVFKQLLASKEQRFHELKFLVSLLMLRHRRLKVVRTCTEEDRDYLIMSFPRSKETFRIEVAELPKEKLESLRVQLMAIFDGNELLAMEAAAVAGPAPAAASPLIESAPIETQIDGPINNGIVNAQLEAAMSSSDVVPFETASSG